MTSTVTFRMVDRNVYEVELPTQQADAMATAVARRWRVQDPEHHVLHLPSGLSVRINPAHVVSIEVR